MVFPSLWEGTPLTVFEALAMGKPIVATDADGLLDVLTDRQDAADRAEGDAAALANAIVYLLEHPRGRGIAGGGGQEDGAALRHCRVRPQDGTVVRPASRNLARDRPRGYPEGGSELPDDTMTIDTRMVAAPRGDAAWPGGWGRAARLPSAFVLVGWALSLDVVKANENGFFGDAATYYTLGHSIADDFDFEYQRADLVRVWHEFPSGSRRHLPEASRLAFVFCEVVHLSAVSPRRSSGCSAPTASMSCNALLMTLSFACAYAFLSARSHPVAALIFAFAFVFVSVAPVYMVQIGPDFFNLRDRADRVFLLVLQGSGRPRADRAAVVVAQPLAARPALGRRRRGAARRRDVFEADANHV